MPLTCTTLAVQLDRGCCMIRMAYVTATADGTMRTLTGHVPRSRAFRAEPCIYRQLLNRAIEQPSRCFVQSDTMATPPSREFRVRRHDRLRVIAGNHQRGHIGALSLPSRCSLRYSQKTVPIDAGVTPSGHNGLPTNLFAVRV